MASEISLLAIVNNAEGLYDGDLRYYLKTVFSAPNVRNPYHNFRHMIHVACEVYDGAKFYEYHRTHGKRRMRALLLAALFHDYGHSGQAEDDALQVSRAIESMKRLVLDSDADLVPEVEYLISLTKFPHDDHADVGLAGEILRDADLSQTFSDVWLQQVVFRLSHEMGITPLEFLRNQPAFLSSVSFRTEWARTRFGPKVEERMGDVKELLGILG